MSLNNISYRHKLFFSFISMSFLIIFIVAIFVIFISQNEYVEKSMDKAELLYQYKVKKFNSHIDDIDDKLFAIKGSKFFVDYLHDGSEDNLLNAEELFLNIAQTDSHIMQVRYIDINGMERIRVNRDASNGSPYLVPRERLQDKRHRYYFKDFSQTPNNVITYSKIDLNYEHGEMERPFKPALRVGLPCFDQNKLQGMLIINIFMKEFLDKFVYSNKYDIYLVDKEDNILDSSDHQYTMSKYINQNRANGSGFHFSDLKLATPFYSNTLGFDNGEGLRLIIKPKDSSFMQILRDESKYVFLLLLSVLLLSFPLAYLFSKYPARLEKELREFNKDLQAQVDKALELHHEKEKMLLHQHRLAQMGEMISMIAHQWRQPLTVISSSIAGLKIKFALEGSCDQETLYKKLSSLETQVDNLSNTINDFRDFYSFNASLEETSIDKVVESSLSLVSAQFKSRNISIHTELKDKSRVETYPNYIQQAIIAILQNAQEAFDTQTDKEKIISVNTYTQDESHIIQIGDNAGGIPEQIIEDIFTPYFSTKNDKNGTGLGLYMAKTIIEKHCNGSIDVHNSNDGVVFTIKI